MKIGVLSDTHLSSPDPRLEYILEELFRSDDMILHAGDIVSHKCSEAPRGERRSGGMREYGRFRSGGSAASKENYSG